MASVVQFSWSRLEGIGLIAAAFGLSLLAQIPLAFFALILLSFELETHIIAMTGSIIGVSIVLTTVICSMSEDWRTPPSASPPTLQQILSLSILFVLILFGGFLLFFIVEPFFPAEIRELSAFQRFFSAYFMGLVWIGVFILGVNRIRTFFAD